MITLAAKFDFLSKRVDGLPVGDPVIYGEFLEYPEDSQLPLSSIKLLPMN